MEFDNKQITEEQIQQTLRFLKEGNFDFYFDSIKNNLPQEVREKDP